MNSSPTNIADFIHALSDMPKSDMLVNFTSSIESLIPFEALPNDTFQVQLDGKWKSLWKTANKFRLESDINSLCLVYGVISATIREVEIHSPLLIIPLSWEYTRVNHSLQLELNDELIEINPYIKFLYSEWMNEQLTDIPEELDLHQKLEWVSKQFNKLSFESTISSSIYVGNFHYHRFHLLRELEGIEKSEHKSSLIQQLLGSDFETPAELDLPPDLLTASDSNQRLVFETLQTKDVLLQGPPGTGKSQVLINILGKSLKSNLKTLVVSEKRVALDVLVKKLSEAQLDSFAFVVHSQTKSRDLLCHLKATWNLLESSNFKSIQNLRLSEQLRANLQLVLDRLNTSDYFAGVSFKELQDLLCETPLVQQQFSSLSPTIDEWLTHKPVIQELDHHLNGFSKLRGLKTPFFEQLNGDQLIKNTLANLYSLQRKLSDLNSFADLEKLIAVLGRCQLVENEHYKAYSQLLSKPKEWKKFQKQVQLLKELTERMTLVEKEKHIWKQMPSKSQMDSWEQANSWIQLRRRKKAISKLVVDSSILPEIALSNWRNYLVEKAKLKELEIYFNEWGLEAKMLDLEIGMGYALSLERESGSLLSEIGSWTKSKREAIIEAGSELNHLRSTLIRYFELNDTVILVDFLLQKQADFVELSAVYEKLKLLPRFFFVLLSETHSWQEMQGLILSSALKKIESSNPEMVKFTSELLTKRLNELIHTENQEFADFAASLHFQIQRKFAAFEELLRTPSPKLSASQKELKTRLKKGKSLLVKEFGKSRNNKTIRNLLESEAKEWVQLLIPIWLATPNQVADHFPLETNLFDLVLFDEASQIPLPNALGSLFRSKRALVAGDEQQMAPSNYFGKNFGFHDLLHQASYYFERVPLRHHYRSEFRELIQFSNKHFYKDELIVYPSPNRKEVLFHHFIENGIFEGRKNGLEAKAVAAFLESFSNWENQTLGMVAFSEEQLKTIWKECSVRVQNLINQKQDEHSLFFKALENVQGDEADILIVSLGYARNSEGIFQLRFGPLNQSNGHKRLNVLLTRAKQEMHFFTSVKSADFELSDNESVNLLRRFLQELEAYQTSDKALVFPYDLEVDLIENNSVRFKNSYAQIPNGVDLATFHRVMKQRNWILNY
jgi:hypothetical protein